MLSLYRERNIVTFFKVLKCFFESLSKFSVSKKGPTENFFHSLKKRSKWTSVEGHTHKIGQQTCNRIFRKSIASFETSCPLKIFWLTLQALDKKKREKKMPNEKEFFVNNKYTIRGSKLLQESSFFSPQY